MNLLEQIPSRESNPFATCWTRPGAIPFLPTRNASVEECLTRLRSHNCRGQILGPHGAGKSTLLRTLGHAIEAGGTPVHWIRAGRGAPAPADPAIQGHVCLVDSFEELSRWRRWQWRQRAWGVVVTTHLPTSLPTLACLAPSLNDVVRCFRQLTSSLPTAVTESDLRDAYHRHGGNTREIWFDLYDRHEQLRRGANHLGRRA